ncbi:UDP-glucose 6-dehydrogenase [candidate division MSBL1 archaeon SCGC-AAA261F19]|uniref:UDP-glucose 6-dehydrogenase n=1 Tax=candidate division MSBL1 archaeon SCGC-AAA261F19 TaxID=1698275 RepID=A0A133VBQ9_9EURY|nr:UDP-glucose 6-dehydrogenase [candidate division MSBL1 archaeon SCGC-AAA261F19]
MEVCVIGSGYVGLTVSVGFASKGNSVTSVDVDEEIVEKINSGNAPFFEESLDEMLEDTTDEGLLRATTDLKDAVGNSSIIFVTVGTPSKEDGTIDLSSVKKSAEEIGQPLRKKDDYSVVVVKSTVVPGTTEETVIPILEEESGKRAGEDFGVCMNPEFLREGRAVSDFLNPDRIVIGEYDEQSGDLLSELYEDFDAPVLKMDLSSAEMVKYASNSFLATKISFINEIGNICKELGIDVYDVAEAMGYDERISERFLRAGAGYGGSCFRKDVGALIKSAEDIGYPLKLIKAGVKVNERQPLKMLDLLEKHVGDLQGREIGVLGLSFKPGTDDIRNSPSLRVVGELLKRGASVKAYDPKAMENFKEVYPEVDYCDPEEVLNSEATLIMTDWGEFEELDYRGKVIIDGRRIEKAKETETYEGICWS